MKMMPLYVHTIVRSISIVSVLLLLSMTTAYAIDIEDYFPLSASSWWHYTGEGQPGGDTDDDYTWTVNGTKSVGGITATKILTTMDEGSGDRHNSEDFWYVDTSDENALLLYGFTLPENIDVEGVITILAQDVELSDPLEIGRDGKVIGDTVSDTATGTVSADSAVGSFEATATVDSTVTYDEMVSEVSTPLGTFSNVLKLTITLEVTKIAGTLPFPIGYQEYFPSDWNIITGEFWFVKNIGLIKHDLDPSIDVEIQILDSGQVNGVTIEGEAPESGIVPAIPGLLLLN